MSSSNTNADDDIGFQKYVANRLSPLSDVEFEVLRSLIWGCSYKEYFDPKEFSEKKYETVFGQLQTMVDESDPKLFLEAAYKKGLVIKSPTSDVDILWPLFKSMEEDKVEDGLYLWSVHEIFHTMKQELADFDAKDETAQKETLEASKNGKALMLFSLELAALNSENKQQISSLEEFGDNGLSLFLTRRMEDYLNVDMATEEGTAAKEQLKLIVNGV
ncbi:hypothetical protein [Alkalimarinus sediminis]|uniref:Uncharacterized protein n=1 Tax=Alkalimarinus sediminis TaxID=1632866 RepID=A0A9E8KHX1_9ALTE|nr:hypothetical protein [Alkalimarinus sediminis]UZW73326.1 hypothetical protein NNL22_09695 [Alkalimarinus sediminis]